MKRFEEILDTCVNDIKSGKSSIEDCLKQHPELRQDLEPLLRIAVGLPRLPAVAPSQEFRRRARLALEKAMARQGLLPRIEEGLARAFRPARLRLSAAVVAVLVAVVVVFGGGGAVAYASQSSLPGDPLYPVKTATEQGRLLVTFGPAAKAQYHLELAQKRVAEVVTLANAGRPINQGTVEAIATQVDTALTDLQKASPQQTHAILAHFSSQMAETQPALAEAQKHASKQETERIAQTNVLVQRGQVIARSISEDPSLRDQPVSVKVAQQGEVKGAISSLNPLVIGGTEVATSPNTRISGALAVGKAATAQGTLGAGGVLQASSIEVQAGTESTAVQFKGAISNLNPLTVAGRKVVLAPDAQVTGVLQVGLIAGIEGELQQDGSVLASHVEVEPVLQEVKLQGNITSLQPLKVGDTVVVLAPDAKVEGSLRLGATAQVTGSFLNDGTFQASSMKLSEEKQGGGENQGQPGQGNKGQPGNEEQNGGKPPTNTPKQNHKGPPAGEQEKPTQAPSSGQETPAPAEGQQIPPATPGGQRETPTPPATPAGGEKKPTSTPTPPSDKETPTPTGSGHKTPQPPPTTGQPTPGPKPGKEEQKEGVIVSIAGNNITVEANKNDRVTVKVTGDTQITIDGSPGNVSDLRVGARVKVQFDPGTGVASEIEQSKAGSSTSGPEK